MARTRLAQIALGLLCVLSMSVGCTNNLARMGAGAFSDSGGSDPLEGLTNGSSGSPINLTRVVRDVTDPNSLDLIGDGTGSMGLYCTSADGKTSSPTGPSVCQCVYDFTKSDGTPEQVLVDTNYRENNLIRCNYSDALRAASPVKIRILIKTSDAYSNEVSINLSNTTGAIDLSNSNSFALVHRYQCQDIIHTIGWAFGSKNQLYDPIQSHDPTINFPLDFYTTDIGKALSIYASNNSPVWNCPSLIDPVRHIDSSVKSNLFDLTSQPELERYTENAFEDSQGLNLRVYSRYSYGGTKVIYNPNSTGPFPRYSFYLAKSSAGVFSVPVNAYIAPETRTSEGSTTAPPLGYGALPVVTGTGKEECPDTSKVSIPAGYKWVKVWLFRAELPVRHYLRSDKIAQMQTVSCNPGFWQSPQDAGAYQSIFPDCNINGDNVGSLTVADQQGCQTAALCTDAAVQVDGVNFLADRVLGTKRCVRVDPGSQVISGFSYQLDQWTKRNNFSLSSGSDPMSPTGGSPYEPTDNSPVSEDIDVLADGALRHDFLFVVTPANVMAEELRNTESPAGRQFTPYRFQRQSDCPYDDPDSAGCDGSRIIRYGLKLHDINNNGDPPADDPTRPGTFPFCALQKE